MVCPLNHSRLHLGCDKAIHCLLFLFLLVGEVMNNMMNRALDVGIVERVPVGRGES